MLERRKLLTGLLALVSAPAIVRASSLMPVKPWSIDDFAKGATYDNYLTYRTIGTREDLSDVIYSISPTETPLFFKLRAEQQIHANWIYDRLVPA
jgi:hypothetical protein